MKNTYLVYILTVFILSISCSQLDDSFRLPGEDSDDIVYYELNNDYLAPESREFIESNFPSVNVNSSYILIGKNTYGFEADLTNEMSLSFDEDGVFKFDRQHPFIKDYYKKGKNGKGIGGGGKGEGRGEGEGKDEGRGEGEGEGEGEEKDEGRGEGEESERCFEFIMPYTIMMPDSSIITLSEESDRDKIRTWYKENPKYKKRPQIQFPVDLHLLDVEEGNEDTLTISSSEDLKKVMERCNEEKGKGRGEGKDEGKGEGKDEGKGEGKGEGKDEGKGEGKDEGKGEGKGKGKRDWCKKLDLSEIDVCIKDYVSSNFPDDKIVHGRTFVTKDDITIHIVKLSENGILKFGEDCEYID